MQLISVTSEIDSGSSTTLRYLNLYTKVARLPDINQNTFKAETVYIKECCIYLALSLLHTNNSTLQLEYQICPYRYHINLERTLSQPGLNLTH